MAQAKRPSGRCLGRPGSRPSCEGVSETARDPFFFQVACHGVVSLDIHVRGSIRMAPAITAMTCQTRLRLSSRAIHGSSRFGGPRNMLHFLQVRVEMQIEMRAATAWHGATEQPWNLATSPLQPLAWARTKTCALRSPLLKMHRTNI